MTDFAKPVLRHLRKLVRAGCPEAEETLKWGHSSFLHNGKILCGMAVFKAHCTFGFWHAGMGAVLAADGIKGDDAMGSFGRIGGLADLPNEQTLLRYVRAAVTLSESQTPGRQKRAGGPAKPREVPADLLAALKKNKAASAAFEAFSPSHRNEYIERITEAKREETRQKRPASTLEWLAEGKSRNWKYESC